MLADNNPLMQASVEWLQTLSARCTRVLDNEDDPRTPDDRAKVAAFRDEINAVLDIRLAKK